MAFVHSYFFKFDFIGFVVLIAAWVLLRGILLRWRRSAMERMQRSLTKPAGLQQTPPQTPPQTQARMGCPRCSAAVPVVARFCPHCGMSLHMLPRPIPLAYSPYPQRRRWPLFLIICLLGVIGLL